MTTLPAGAGRAGPVPSASRGPHRGSLRCGRVLGVEVRLHWTFLLLVGFVFAVDHTAGIGAGVAWLVWLVAVFASVLVHELSHCVVARRRGAVVRGILLTPIGGLSELEAMPESPADELVIAAVGPLTSLGLGLAAGAVGVLTGAALWPPTLFAGSWVARILWLNLLLGAFNLLPALPMDGGRVLRAALAVHRDRREATLLAVRVARVLGALMIAVGVAYDLWLAFIGVFVLMGASAEEDAATGHDGPRTPDDGRRGLPSAGVSGSARSGTWRPDH